MALNQKSVIIAFLALSSAQFPCLFGWKLISRHRSLPESRPPADHKRSCFATATAFFSGLFHVLPPRPATCERSVRSRRKDVYNVCTMESANFLQSKHQQAQRRTNKRQLISSLGIISLDSFSVLYRKPRNHVHVP